MIKNYKFKKIFQQNISIKNKSPFQQIEML